MNKKELKLHPEEFDLECSSVWSFPRRGKWATHKSDWRGNWAPEVARNLILRYSKEKEHIFDCMIGGGTTAIEAKILNRHITCTDINQEALKRTRESLKFNSDNIARQRVKKADARNLSFIKDKEIDFIVISTPNNLLKDVTVRALDAGKHVFCEKPIDLNPIEIRKTLEVVRKAGAKLQVGFNRRFDHNFMALKEAVTRKKIGNLHTINITSRDPSPPSIDYIKKSGGLFLDMTIHDFDMVRYLSDSEVDEVFAYGAVRVDPEIGKAGDIDTAVITLRYANGAIGTIDNSRQAVYGYDQRVEVFGSEGSLVASNNTPHNVAYSGPENVQFAKPFYFFLERYSTAYIAEMKAFITAIEKDSPPLVTGVDGRIPVVMGLAAWKSYRENRPVKLNEISLLG